MKTQTQRIAFYGKGGIGKSTIAVNTSVALALRGKSVLYIGCDPKADSVRALTGRRISTVLDLLNESEAPLTREQIVNPGSYGISCVEAGGPRSGTGCAGLGITAMMDELTRLKITDEGWDFIVYDVLGDVVCGGFAVPMRKRYADLVYLVTSADYMALYAANNILRGVAAYSLKTPMLGGIIHNHSESDGGQTIVGRFAEKANGRIIGAIPRHNDIRLADYGRVAIHTFNQASEVLEAFELLAENILKTSGGTIPSPLSDEELESMCYSVICAETVDNA